MRAQYTNAGIGTNLWISAKSSGLISGKKKKKKEKNQ